MEDNRKEAEAENSVKEIPGTENRGGTYADIYAEGGLWDRTEWISEKK